MRSSRNAILVILALLAGLGASPALAQPKSGDPGAGTSGLPVPRYVSLKSDRVNLRSGPGTDYPTAWVYRRAGLPLEVIREFEGWRQVRDAEGTSGWVLQSFLSGRRTALIEPNEVKAGAAAPQISVYDDPNDKSVLVAKVEAGVIANVLDCNGTWCRISIDPFKGFIQQKRLWGVYPAEVVK
jgi:SH3-like domain-containing protein